ncbi:F-box associated domain containing protein [Tanacetum coccineum]
MFITNDVNRVNIYSLKTGKWKIIGDFSYEYPFDGCGIFSNGALHWVAYSDSPRTERIVSLDLAKETYGVVLQPEGGKNLSLGVLGECLCGLCYYYGSHADLWVMKVYGVKDSWTKLASFPYLTHPWIDMYPVPLFISNDGNVLIRCATDLVIYNSKDSSFEYFDRCCKDCVVVVVESLVSPFPPLALADNNEN